MGGPDLAEMLHEVAAQPQPPSRLDSAALFAAGRRRRSAVTALRTTVVVGALALALLAGAGIAAGLNRQSLAPLAMPGRPYLSGLPIVYDQPGAACRERLTTAAGQLADALPVDAVWISGYTKDCASPYVRMTADTPHAIYWVVLMTVPDEFPQPGACTQTACRQTELGQLTWGTGTGGLYRDPPGQIGAGLTYAGLDRTRDGMRRQLFEWLTYPPTSNAPAHPHGVTALSDALLTATQALVGRLPGAG